MKAYRVKPLISASNSKISCRIFYMKEPNYQIEHIIRMSFIWRVPFAECQISKYKEGLVKKFQALSYSRYS